MKNERRKYRTIEPYVYGGLGETVGVVLAALGFAIITYFRMVEIGLAMIALGTVIILRSKHIKRKLAEEQHKAQRTPDQILASGKDESKEYELFIREEPKEYTKDHHLNKIEDIDTKEALELLLRELETKSSTTQKYFSGNIAVLKNGNKWMHIVAQFASFSIIIYGTFNENDLKQFQKVSTSAKLRDYGITLEIEKPSQIEELLKLIL